MEQQLHEVVHHFHHPLLGLIGSTLGIHTRYRHGIFRSDDTHFLYLLVELLVGYQVGCFGIAQVGFLLQTVTLGGKLRQVGLLLMHHAFRSLHYGRENGIHRTQYDCREEHDAETQDKGTEKGKDVYRLGTGYGSPYPKGNVKECTQARNTLGNARHLGTERHHLIIGGAEQLV